MQKKAIFIILLLLTPLVEAKIEDYENYSALEAFVDISTTINITHLSNRYAVEYLWANLTFFPRKGYTQLLDAPKAYSNPKAETEERENSIFLKWTNPENCTQINYGMEGKVKTFNSFTKIPQKVFFPLQYLPKEYFGYLQPTKILIINNDIKKKATEIAEGEDDAYKVVFKIAEWVKDNIKYDLTTMTASAVKDSVWVFENKRGVCDELTNLYIAMLRSLGIPARFASGMAYSNINYRFGEHGWAEVFLPGYGWIPIDVTFGQFGWIDPSHIKFQMSDDGSTPSADYEWKSKDINVETGDLKPEIGVLNAYGPEEKFIEVKVEVLKDSVGFGSYTPMIVNLNNPNKFYVPTKVTITKAPGFVEESNTAHVLLVPESKKSLFWIVKIPEDLNKELLYTANLEATAVYGNTASTDLKYADGFEVMTQTWAKENVERLKEKEGKSFFPELKISCSLDKEKYYHSEKAKVVCATKNLGNVNLEKINACLGIDCKEINLTISEEKISEWTMNLTEVKTQKLVVTAEYKELISYANPNIDVVEIPEIKIENFLPKSIGYKEEGNMEFTIISTAPANEVVVEVEGVGAFKINQLIGSHDLVIPFIGKRFYKQKALVNVFFKDELNKGYSIQKEFQIEITRLPWYIKLLNWLDNLV